MSRPLLICRPLSGAQATARRARDMGLETLLYPLFRIEALRWDAPDPARFDALLLTSANAIRHGGQALHDYHPLPLFAVGESSARAAIRHGFTDVTTAGPDAQATARALEQAGHRRILHLCGANVRALAPGPLSITRRAVYHAVEEGDAAGLAPLLQGEPVILVHSPRAGERLAAIIPPDRRATLSLIAISPAALDAAGEGWQMTVAVPAPDDGSMLALARQICQ